MAPHTHLTYLAKSSRIGIRPWHRRHDRRQIDHWPPYTPTLPAHWLAASRASGERLSYAVDLLGVHLTGRISLLISDSAARLGIALHPGHLGSGLGTEAMSLMLVVGRQLGLSTLQLDVAAENIRAARCYQRAGYVAVGEIWRGGYRYELMERGL
ncbi:GNAT family N-acetyltransferase [Oscillochloris sp. ZM17-4]|uniref:GNAT family N-acetyltransferase n=1 Tax=Oscillochloris sp. ZM17-4 TaxID=2866714 RepID=UPI001C72EDA1|nr:GNAT family N-acetyltransferase [Oscillochloris sp. ZM17-4]MBX0326971.1 GNAT family N-acetyltransferase [Oscillochloris sp. ZM17-4]